MRATSRFRLLILLSIVGFTTSAFGSGFALFESGAKGVAMGGAFAATADDPSAIWYNVAGLAQQRRGEVLFGATNITFNNQFTGDPNDLFAAGTTGVYRHHDFIVPNAYASIPIGNNITIGAGVFSPFGLRTNWQAPWVGRYVSSDANIKTVSFEPAIAWQTSDGRFAIGGGPEIRRSKVILAQTPQALNPFNGRITDVANVYLSSSWKTKTGWNAGVLFKPTSAWRVGLSYRAPMTVGFTGTATVTQIPSGNPEFDAIAATQLPPTGPVSTSIAFPDFLYLAVANSSIQNWDIEADVVRNSWSRFKLLQINFANGSAIQRHENWKSTFSYRVGANHTVNDTWDVRFGALYDQTPEPTDVVGPLLPDANRIGGTFGIGYRRGPFVLEATEFFLHFLPRSTQMRSNPEINLNGRYTTEANLVTVDLGYRF